MKFCFCPRWKLFHRWKWFCQKNWHLQVFLFNNPFNKLSSLCIVFRLQFLWQLNLISMESQILRDFYPLYNLKKFTILVHDAKMTYLNFQFTLTHYCFDIEIWIAYLWQPVFLASPTDTVGREFFNHSLHSWQS